MDFTLGAGHDRYGGTTPFLLEKPGPLQGVQCRRIDTLGLAVALTHAVTYDNVCLPATSGIGAPGRGWQALLHGLAMERFHHGAIAAGASQAIVDTVVRAVRQRAQFGRPLGTFQAGRRAA